MKQTEPGDWDDLASYAVEDEDEELELDEESGSDDLDLENIRIFTPDTENESDEDLDFEAASAPLPIVDLDTAFDGLMQGDAAAAWVHGFNDLAAADLPLFAARGPRLDNGVRLAVITNLVELAEDDYRFELERVLLAASEDLDVAVRQQAVVGLSEVQTPAVARRLLEILRDDVSDDVRASAAASLGPFVILAEWDELESELADRIRESVFDVAEDEDESWHLRLRAAESASGTGPNDRVGALIERLWEEDEIGLRPGAILMAGKGNMRQWLPTVRQLLTEDDPALRFEAITAAGLMQDVESLPELSEIALREDDVDIRHQAIRSVGAVGGMLASRILERLIEEAPETDRDVIDEAVMEATLEENLNLG
jgi:HEAT repeat protein